MFTCFMQSFWLGDEPEEDRNHVKPKVFVGNEELKVLKSFTHLGSVLLDDGRYGKGKF